MLENLDSIDWQALRHAYGPASDVPGLLRGLISADASVRQSAVTELFGSIWHQGTIYDSTAAAIPFLYDLLVSPGTLERSSIACLLASIATGRGYLEVHAASEADASERRHLLQEEGRDLEAERARERREVADVRALTVPRLSLLVAYLDDAEPEVRATVAEALGAYPEQCDLFRPRLRVAYEVETIAEVRDVLARVIGGASDSGLQGAAPSRAT